LQVINRALGGFIPSIVSSEVSNDGYCKPGAVSSCMRNQGTLGSDPDRTTQISHKACQTKTTVLVEGTSSARLARPDSLWGFCSRLVVGKLHRA